MHMLIWAFTVINPGPSEANWSESVLFVIQYVNWYQQPGSTYLIGWKLEVGIAF